MNRSVDPEATALVMKNTEDGVRGVAEEQGEKAATGAMPIQTKHGGDGEERLHKGVSAKYGYQSNQQSSSHSMGDTMTGDGSLRSRNIKRRTMNVVPPLSLYKTSTKGESVQDDYLMRLLGKGNRIEGPSVSGKQTRGSLPSGLSAATQTVLGTSPPSPGTFRVPEPKITSNHNTSSNQLTDKQQATTKQQLLQDAGKCDKAQDVAVMELETTVPTTQETQATQPMQATLGPASLHRPSLPSMGWSYAETERYVGQEIADALRSAVIAHQISYVEQLYDLHRATAVQKLLVQNCPEIEYVVEEATRALKKSLDRGKKRNQRMQAEVDDKEYLHPDSQFAAAPHRDRDRGETGDYTAGGAMTGGDGSGDDADGGSGGSGANGSGGGSTSPQPHQVSGAVATPNVRAGGNGALAVGMQRPLCGRPDTCAGGGAAGGTVRSGNHPHGDNNVDMQKGAPSGLATRSPNTHNASQGCGHNGHNGHNGHHHHRTRGTHNNHNLLAGAPSGASQTPTNTNGTGHTANRHQGGIHQGPQMPFYPQILVPQNSNHAGPAGPALQFAPGPMPSQDPMGWWYQTYYGRQPMVQQYHVAIPNAASQQQAADNRHYNAPPQYQHPPVPLKWWQDPIMTFGGPAVMDMPAGDTAFQGANTNGNGNSNGNGNASKRRHAQNNASLVEIGAAEADSLPQTNTVTNGTNGLEEGQERRPPVIVRPARRARKRKPSDPIDEASSGTTGQDHHAGPHANLQTQQDERKGGVGNTTSVSTKGQDKSRGKRSGPVGADANDAAKLLLSFSSKGIVDLPK